jgi:hypothetical protein
MGKKITNVEVRERSPWGESLDESFVNDPGRTSTFIGGYSDKRAEFERESRAGGNPKPLAHRLHWARTERPNGEAEGRRVAEFKRKGYTKPTWDEVMAAGYDLTTCGAIKGPDNSIKLGDTVLMWCPAPIAAANVRRVREETKAASDAYQKRVEEATEKANQQMGYKQGSRGATAPVFELEGDNFKK